MGCDAQEKAIKTHEQALLAAPVNDNQIANIPPDFSIQAFNSLDLVSKRKIYQEANESHNIALVRQLNELGMTPPISPFSGPNILSNFMDIATKYDTISNLDYVGAKKVGNDYSKPNEFSFNLKHILS